MPDTFFLNEKDRLTFVVNDDDDDANSRRLTTVDDGHMTITRFLPSQSTHDLASRSSSSSAL